jgi:hypothetical protein
LQEPDAKRIVTFFDTIPSSAIASFRGADDHAEAVEVEGRAHAISC